jgi:glycerophosphoryl diester phosphodiesterase
VALALQAFPDRKFLIDHKDGSMASAQLLVTILQALSVEQHKRLYYWGPDETYHYVHDEIPSVTPFFSTRPQIQKWLLPYLLTLGTSVIPEESKGYVMGMPPPYTKVVWGWPYRFLSKVSKAGAKFYLMIDTEKDAKAFLDIPIDGIVTDHIEMVGKHYKK